MNIKTTSTSGELVDASLSVLVINKDQLGELQSKRQNILSYFLLGSELKGEIETPGFYFDGASTLEDLDALMLTQGWRKYLYIKPYEELSFKPEKVLTITGGVTNGLFQKEKMSKLTMLSFGDGFQAISSMTDSAGRFSFVLDEEYGDKMEVIIQSANVDGENKDYMVTLDQKKTPPVNFGQTSAIAQLDSTVFELVRKEEERRQVEEAFRATSGTIMIGQVDVDGFKRTAMSNNVIKLAGKPDLVMDGEVLQEEEQDWSYGLFSELDFASDNLNIDIYQDENFDYGAVVRGSDETLVLVDGDYDPIFNALIAYIPIREVSSVDVIKCADNFELIWADKKGALPTRPIYCGSIININTVRGKGIGDVLNKFKGINRFMIPVFSTPKEYYTPNYETMKPEELNKPDLRLVLRWQPLLSTDSLGIATTSFYNADNVGDMTIVVEAISKDGEIGYTTIGYKVKGK